MRTDPRADFLRTVNDGSSQEARALWNAILALEAIARGVPGTGTQEHAAAVLERIDEQLTTAPERGGA